MNFEKLNIIPRDTTPEAFRYHIQVLRNLGPDGRAKLTAALCIGLRRTVEAGVHMRHPEYDDSQIKLAVIRLTVGEVVYRRLFPDVRVVV